MELGKEKNKIFILGAGSSKDYGLPIWSELSVLINQYLSSEDGKGNLYKKEIFEWLDLIGEQKKYKTLDECIYYESSSNKYKENGQDVEFTIFSILKSIFDKLYKKEESWIKNLNEKIREKGSIDWNNLFFINYNYDSVLADNILDYSYLSKTERERIYRERLTELSDIRNKNVWEKIPCLYPHGLFYHSDRGFLYEQTDTINSHDNSLLQAVSCYHSKKHEIIFSNYSQGVELYILGLGGGLKINLNNLIFKDINKIKNIYITIRPSSKKTEQENEREKKEIINFLKEKFNLLEGSIKTYDDCISLINDCFSVF